MPENPSENLPPVEKKPEAEKAAEKVEKKENPELSLGEANVMVDKLEEFSKLVRRQGKIEIEEKDAKYEIAPMGDMNLIVKKMDKEGKISATLRFYWGGVPYASMSINGEAIAHVDKKYVRDENGKEIIKFETYNGRVMKNKVDEMMQKTQDMFAAKKAAEEERKRKDAEDKEKLRKEMDAEKAKRAKEEELQNIKDQLKADKEQKERFSREKAEEAARAKAKAEKEAAEKRAAEEAKKKAEQEKLDKAQKAKDF